MDKSYNNNNNENTNSNNIIEDNHNVNINLPENYITSNIANNILNLKVSLKSGISRGLEKHFFAPIEEVSEKQYLGHKEKREISKNKKKKKRGRKKKKINENIVENCEIESETGSKIKKNKALMTKGTSLRPTKQKR